MNDHESVRVITREMQQDLEARCVKAVPADTPFDIGQLYVSDRAALNRRMREIFVPPPVVTVAPAAEFEEHLASQESFWRRLFPTESFDFDPAKILVWPRRAGHDRLIVVPKGLWANKLYTKCEEQFTCWRYTGDLDKMVHLSGSPYKATARWFRDRQEADEELANKSALKLEELLVPGITLPERIAYELKYFEETKDHLDKKNVTLCSGSRYPGGDVPSACWSDDEFRVGGSYPSSAYDHLRSRGV